jgi:Glycosyltransferase family 87
MNLLSKQFFKNKWYIFSIWMLLPFLNWILEFFRDRYNNYKIFRQVFFHSLGRLNLYAYYDKEYFDSNHYGPIFALIIAPFAVLPDIWGSLLWSSFNAIVLFYAIFKMPLKQDFKILIIILCTIEMANGMWSNQFNSIEASFILLTFILVQNKKDFWAPLFIVLGTFIKLYAIIGLAFFVFSSNKKMFVIGCFTWAIVLYLLPMLLTSPQYVNTCYYDWYISLVDKNNINVSLTSSTDASIMGIVRRLFQNASIPNTPFIVTGVILYLMPFLRFSQYKYLSFKLLCLASSLMLIILLSSSSEHPSYIYPMLGVSIWYILLGQKKYDAKNISLLCFVLIIGGLGPTDALGKTFRVWLINHSLKALPFAIVWFLILKDGLFRNFANEKDLKLQENV